ncbi:MAG TPA: hypothetical protein VIU40_02785 [Geobacteraceae bacterium]
MNQDPLDDEHMDDIGYDLDDLQSAIRDQRRTRVMMEHTMDLIWESLRSSHHSYVTVPRGRRR